MLTLFPGQGKLQKCPSCNGSRCHWPMSSMSSDSRGWPAIAILNTLLSAVVLSKKKLLALSLRLKTLLLLRTVSSQERRLWKTDWPWFSEKIKCLWIDLVKELLETWPKETQKVKFFFARHEQTLLASLETWIIKHSLVRLAVELRILRA